MDLLGPRREGDLPYVWLDDNPLRPSSAKFRNHHRYTPLRSPMSSACIQIIEFIINYFVCIYPCIFIIYMVVCIWHDFIISTFLIPTYPFSVFFVVLCLFVSLFCDDHLLCGSIWSFRFKGTSRGWGAIN